MNKIREIDPLNNTITVEAGAMLQTRAQAAAEVDRLFPQLLPAPKAPATIGGNLSTNAGGTVALALRHPRALCARPGSRAGRRARSGTVCGS